MSKFEVGDRVRIIVTGNEGTIAGNFFTGWDVLLDTEPRKPDLHAGWYYRTSDLELIEETPDPRDDALDRIAAVYANGGTEVFAMHAAIIDTLRETGRLQ